MTSKPMDNAALVANDQMDPQGQHARNPPGYSSGAQQGMNYSGQNMAGYYGTPAAASSSQYTTVQMNPGPQQPMVIVEAGAEPQTTCSLVMSTLNTIFCFAWPLGLMAIALSWQARLHVIDRKYAHARHTLTVSWIVNGMGFVFGLLIWGVIIWVFSIAASASRYGYSG